MTLRDVTSCLATLVCCHVIGRDTRVRPETSARYITTNSVRAIIGWPPPRDDQAMAQALPTAFSQESAGDQVVPLGSGKWWGRVLVPNNMVTMAPTRIRTHTNARSDAATMGF